MKVKGTDIHCGIVTNGVFAQFANAREAALSVKCSVGEVVPLKLVQNDKVVMSERTSWTMTIGCLNSDNISALWDVYKNRRRFTVSWREVNGTENREFTGYAYIKGLSINDNIHAVSQMSIELQGTGELTYRLV